jgi:UDP-N-acetylglucosamine 2-epimerase
VLVTRDTTERPEAVAAGANRLVGTDPQRIIAAVSRLLTKPDEYAAMQIERNPYGDGAAAGRIVHLVASRFGREESRAGIGSATSPA